MGEKEVIQKQHAHLDAHVPEPLQIFPIRPEHPSAISNGFVTPLLFRCAMKKTQRPGTHIAPVVHGGQRSVLVFTVRTFFCGKGSACAFENAFEPWRVDGDMVC
jgi:hypothetical protein